MNDVTPVTPTSPFSDRLPGLQLAWDSTSLSFLKQCPRLYQYVIVDGYTGGTNDNLEFGQLFHSALELYARLATEGELSHDQMMIKIARWLMVNTWDFELGRPRLTDDEEPNKTRDTLFRTTIWYLDRFRNDPMKTMTLPNGQPAVEVSFRFGLDADDGDEGRFRTLTTGEEFILCGHLDKIAEWNDGTWIVDRKTTKYDLDSYYFRQYYPDNQMSLYDIAGAVVLSDSIKGVVVDAAQVLVNGSRYRRQPIDRTPEQREDWLRDLSMWLHMAETFAVANHWPQNEKSCGYGKYRCAFWTVCSSDPRARQGLLNSDFVRRESRWNPLEPR